MVAPASTDSKLAQHITHETAARHIKLICLVASEHIHCHADNSIYHTTLGCIYTYIHTYMTYYDSQYLKSLLPQLQYKCKLQ
jgi:hypothetical protein